MMFFKEVFIVLCASAATRTNEEFDLISYVRNVSNTVCPYTNYCTTKTANIINDDTSVPCCSDCSCDASTCYETENCCPDLEPAPVIASASDLICADTMTKVVYNPDSRPFHDGYSYGIKRYFIVTSCPADFEDEYVHSMCRGDNKTEVDDFLWVSHSVTDTIYQNYYCAMCHGAQDWVTWDLRTNCFIKLMQEDFQNISATILSDNCNIVNEVPESKVDVSRKYQCYLPRYTSCNKTGNWADYDPNIEKACESFTQIYLRYISTTGTVDVYKNVFCMICNYKFEVIVPAVCPSQEGDNARLCMKECAPFSAVVNFRATKERPTVERPQCSMAETYDEYMSLCRALQCPLGSAAIDGDCEPMVTGMIDTRGFAIMFVVNVNINQSGITDRHNVALLGQKLAWELEILSGISKCRECSIMVKKSSTTGLYTEIRVLLVKRPKAACQLEHIYKGISAVSGKKIEIQLTPGVRLTAVSRISENYDYNRGETIVRTVSDCMVSNPIQITEPLCPSIELAFSESITLEDGKKKQEFLTFFQNVENLTAETTVSICKKDYINVMRQTGGSEARNRLELTDSFIIYMTLLYFV